MPGSSLTPADRPDRRARLPETPGVDFLIIGTQKGGTTSLFEYMRRHPQVHMPNEKEIAFFNRERSFRRGPDWYLATVLRDAPQGAVCGEASTYYMSGTPFGELGQNELHPPEPSGQTPLEEVVPRRIKECLPDVKLIGVLRDPVSRACSHHRMMCLERAEARPFEKAIEEQLNPSALRRARIAPTRTNNYVVMGEYGRVLGAFLRVFPREQLMVTFSDELKGEPEKTLAKIFDFVGVDSGFVPDNLHTQYRKGAASERIPGFNLYEWQAELAGLRPARKLWRALPSGVRGRIDRTYRLMSYRTAMWNARRGVDEVGVSPTTRDRLISHYRPDSEALADLVGRPAPWLAAWANP
jgi:hypothetical protein